MDGRQGAARRRRLDAVIAAGGSERTGGLGQGQTFPAQVAQGRRYVTLDGMRGLAAIAVALFHFDIALMPHGYLAVDFFFALSGFVLTKAYRDRLEAGYGTRRFLVARLIRLYPLFLMGVILSALLAMQKVAAGLPTTLDNHKIAVSVLFNSAMLPSPVDLPLFPLNVPSWSLFFELIANVALVLLLFRLPAMALVGICLASAAVLAPIVLEHGSGNIGALWGEYTVALARTAFSFTAGVLIALLPERRAEHRSARWLAGACLAAIVVLLIGSAQLSIPRYDLAAILAASPVLVWAGARVEPSRLLAPVATFIGEVSYALYAIHWSFIDAFRALQETWHLPSIVVAPVYVAAILLVAWVCVQWFDVPLRRRFGAMTARLAPRPALANAA